MYLWRRQASQKWWSNHQDELRAAAGKGLAIIEQAGRKRLDLEVTCRSRSDGQKLAKAFGGRLQKLPRDWLKRFSRQKKGKPLKIGRRLIVVNVGGTSVSRLRLGSPPQGASHLLIPASTAFGTGEHATTAMSIAV